MPAFDEALFQENERTSPQEHTRRYAELGPYTFEVGASLPSVTLAYETWGTLRGTGENAILVLHALSGDSHCVGWWDRLIGPGKPIDPARDYIIGVNALGGCSGSTGPSSLAPDGRPWGSRFPMLQIGDMVATQRMLLDALGITELHAVVGGSMGGMQAIEWGVRYPGFARKIWVTASCASHGPMQIGFNEAGRQAVMRDPKWRGGDYALDDPPRDGLSVARMIGHLTFLSEPAFEAKFGRRLQGKAAPDYHLGVEYEVESYLNYQGDKFTNRFDANSFLRFTRAIDYFCRDSFRGATADWLVTAFASDWIYPAQQCQRVAELAREAGCRAEYHEIDLPYGHDAFLLDGDQQGDLLAGFLSGVRET